MAALCISPIAPELYLNIFPPSFDGLYVMGMIEASGIGGMACAGHVVGRRKVRGVDDGSGQNSGVPVSGAEARGRVGY
ncbi:Monooxygenase, flavin-binding family [Leifsonia rubra CMS 76R]|nr:Monooxygenase, flavin-binding family [Leifsonia rubra CMS 76R]